MLQMAKDKKMSHMKGSDKKGPGVKYQCLGNSKSGGGGGGGASEDDDSGSEPPERVAIVPLPLLSPAEQLAQHTARLRSTGYSYLSPDDDDAYSPMSKVLTIYPLYSYIPTHPPTHPPTNPRTRLFALIYIHTATPCALFSYIYPLHLCCVCC